MALVNCERCGKVFNSEKGETVCPDCIIEEKKALKKVTDYLREHPLSTVMEVSEKTGVSQTHIFRFIREGSLKIKPQPQVFKCKICGAPIKSGTLCNKCSAKVKDTFKDKK